MKCLYLYFNEVQTHLLFHHHYYCHHSFRTFRHKTTSTGCWSKAFFWKTRSGSLFFFECWGYTKKKHLSFLFGICCFESQVLFWVGWCWCSSTKKSRYTCQTPPPPWLLLHLLISYIVTYFHISFKKLPVPVYDINPDMYKKSTLSKQESRVQVLSFYLFFSRIIHFEFILYSCSLVQYVHIILHFSTFYTKYIYLHTYMFFIFILRIICGCRKYGTTTI